MTFAFPGGPKRPNKTVPTTAVPTVLTRLSPMPWITKTRCLGGSPSMGKSPSVAETPPHPPGCGSTAHTRRNSKPHLQLTFTLDDHDNVKFVKRHHHLPQQQSGSTPLPGAWWRQHTARYPAFPTTRTNLLFEASS